MGRYDYAEAFDQLHTLTQSHPLWMDGLVDLSIAQLNRQLDGDEATALSRLATVLDRDGEHLRARYVKGLLLLNAGNPEGALVCFERVATVDPKDAYAAYYTGQALGQLGRSADAAGWFAKSIAMDPYLRSSYYAGAQSARRSGDAALANAWLATFQRMEHNPRAVLAELKYTRMGPKAEVQAIEVDVTVAKARPEGPVFDRDELGFKGCDHCPSYEGISVARIDERTLVLCPTKDYCELMVLGGGSYLDDVGQWAISKDAPLIARVALVRGALWGDVDADGHIDVVLLRNGINELWLGREDLIFERGSRFDGGESTETVDGALFDADHDGDLDALFLQSDGRLQLVNNNGDGSWQDITGRTFGPSAAGGEGREGRALVVADFDGDLDTDVLCLNAAPPHRAWINDRLWSWHAVDEGWSALLETKANAAVASDFDADGAIDVVTLADDGGVDVWSRSAGPWQSTALAKGLTEPPALDHFTATRGQRRPRHLAVADLTGDGAMDVLCDSGWFEPPLENLPVMRVLAHDGTELQSFLGQEHWTLCTTDTGQGPGYIAAGASGSIITIPSGPGRFPFVGIELSGRTDPGQSIRSNASGIGTTVAARVGTRWTITGAVRNTAGPGQNLQPISIGLGGADAIDFVAIDWTDGVYQTEANLKPGDVHTIVETQRQLSSCPVLFGWDGERMSFITDCLGVGGLGFLLKPGTYAEPRPWERVLLPVGAVQPRNGMLDMVIAEPMQETCYLDDVTMLSVDLPEGWEVLPDERMGTGGASPTGALLFSQHTMSPYAAHTTDGRDITEAITQRDGIAADPGPVHTRFIGRTVEPFDLAAFFNEAFDAHEGTPLLVLDAWVEYPYAQTMFAAWQAGVIYAPLSIEVQVNGNLWIQVAEHVGYPAGMPRTMVLPLPNLPAGAKNIRIRTTLECYIDNLRIAWAQDCPEAVVHETRPAMAELFEAGYPTRTDGPHRRPHYDWDARSPFWDTRTQRGLYSALGDVLPLVQDRDGALAVFGVGEAVRVNFWFPDGPPMGMHRRHVLDLGGWAKDMDFMTRTGATVEPIPGARDATAADLLDATRVRYRDGR